MSRIAFSISPVPIVSGIPSILKFELLEYFSMLSLADSNKSTLLSSYFIFSSSSFTVCLSCSVCAAKSSNLSTISCGNRAHFKCFMTSPSLRISIKVRFRSSLSIPWCLIVVGYTFDRCIKSMSKMDVQAESDRPIEYVQIHPILGDCECLSHQIYRTDLLKFDTIR